MKKSIFLLFAVILLSNSLNAQITGTLGDLLLEDSLDFRPQSEWIRIPDSLNNLWASGIPSKEYFDSGLEDNIAMLTDTLNPYPVNCNDHFYVYIPRKEYTWGEGIISFYHKFDTDSLLDGGIIEMSYDDGASWINLRNDRNHISTNFIGLYEDTIIGGEYGFSGRSEGWQYMELYWHWIALLKKSSRRDPVNAIMRFRFVSDNNHSGKEGWMIDDIVFRGYDVVGNIQKIEKDDILVYYVPSLDYIKIESGKSLSSGFKLTLWDLTGKMISSKKLSGNQFHTGNMEKGLYIYQLYGDELLKTGKIVIK